MLQEKKINEIKLINMGEDDIRRIDGLTSSQKNLLLIRKNNVKSPNYTNDLEKVIMKLHSFSTSIVEEIFYKR